MRWIILLTSFAIACNSEPHISLAQLADLRLGVVVHNDSFDVVIDAQDAAPPACPVFGDDLHARLGAVALTLAEPGGKGPDGCIQARLSAQTAPPTGESYLEVRDPSLTLRCELPDVQTARSVALVPAAPWQLKTGQPYVVQWSPGSDLSLFDVSVDLQAVDTGRSVNLLDATNDRDFLHITLPNSPPGAYKLNFAPNGTVPIPCNEGVVADVSSDLTHFGLSQPITITR
jgi:hypothetical protein